MARHCYEIITSASGRQKVKEATKAYARVFIARTKLKAIAVGMLIDENDMWYESEFATVLDNPFTEEDLGTAIAAEMQKTERRGRGTSGRKLTDWPAFKVSGEGSVKVFEQSFIEISVQSANASNLAVVITGSPEKGANLLVTSMMSTAVPPAELGLRILDVYNACLDRRL